MSSSQREPMYLELAELIVAYATPPEPLVALLDDGQSCRMRPTALTLASPVELQVCVSSIGHVELLTAPPLYDLDTTFRPVFHQLTIHVDVTLSNEDGW